MNLEGLNSSQRAAVEYNDGPQLVIAGAGSGKTRVLTYKIAYLLSQGVPANRILALTFTNKAAREMRDRIARMVDAADVRYLWMGTFHSICSKILRHEAEHIGFTRDFTIYDSQDQKSLVKQVLKLYSLDDKVYKPNTVLGRISAAKNALIQPSDYARNESVAKQDRQDRLYEMPKIYSEYQTRLRAANAMDFDDLLMYVCLLLEKDEAARRYYQQVFQYVLVDEYQDTNYVQYRIVSYLAEPENRICVVGDDAQSIYSFRGADIRNILHFQQGYPNARLFKLEQNYRSTQTIVKAANSLIHHNENQIYKEVFSEKEPGERIDLVGYMTDRNEGEGVARSIQQYHAIKGVSYNDIAVLYRTNAQSRTFENEFRKLGIAYRIYGGMSFYQRKEIKDAIAYFRLAVNPKDNEALVRVINYPARGIGETTIRKVSECATMQNTSMLEVVQHPIECGLEVSKATASKLGAFGDLIATLHEAADTMNAYEFAEKVMLLSGIRTAAVMDRTPEGIDRAENLQELLTGIHELIDRRTEEGIDFTPIHDFLAEVSLLTDQDQNLTDDTPRVTLMTVHAAKGLEFEVVYIVGLEENLFPSQMCVKPSEIEEERRLLYVALTRAMQYCHMSYARQRFRNGSVQFSSPSRFLRDIDRQYIALREGSVAGTPATAAPRWRNNSWSTPSKPAMPSVPTKPLTHISDIKTETQSAEYQAGERVRHGTFGEGTVLQVYEENGTRRIDILFDKFGKKAMLIQFAKLEKI
ncbi:MAG: UvrD-helicase domain-containing protein [Paludibacteraceae bacterium]|nr:UvrD-helicase domain-containing protein [Paludibacteraceae bacterium]